MDKHEFCLVTGTIGINPNQTVSFEDQVEAKINDGWILSGRTFVVVSYEISEGNHEAFFGQSMRRITYDDQEL